MIEMLFRMIIHVRVVYVNIRKVQDFMFNQFCVEKYDEILLSFEYILKYDEILSYNHISTTIQLENFQNFNIY